MFEQKKISHYKQAGFTLVELMIGLLLGLILTAGVVQTFIATKQTSLVTNGLANIQENGRFALHFLNKDLRTAGYAGCIGKVTNNLNNNQTQFISKFSTTVGWNYSGTASNNAPFTLSGINNLNVGAAAATWQTVGIGQLPNFIVGNVAIGSDVLSFKEFTLTDTRITNHPNTTADIATSTHNFPINSILLVGDCSNAELFENISNNNNSLSLGGGPGAAIGNRQAQWNKQYTNGDRIYAYTRTFYYIGQGASGLPALFRFRTNLPDSAITAAIFNANTQELVDGVESLQLLYGEDSTNDDNPNQYISAHQVNSWDNIVSLRIGLLLRSTNFATDADQAKNFTLLDSIRLTHPADDQLLRYAINSTLKLRNKALGQQVDYFVCDTTNDTTTPADSIPTCP